MNRVSILAIVLLVMSGCGPGEGAAGEDAEGPVVTYFENGRVILGDGSDPIEDAAILVDDGVILAVGPKDPVEHPAGADRYDMSEHTAVPFLVNLHGHVGYQRNTNFGSQNYSPESARTDLDRYLYYGVGAVAVLGTDLGVTAVQIRSEQQAGQNNSALIFTAGRGITARDGFPSTRNDMADVPIQVGSEDEARQAVRDLATLGVDFVKIWVDDNRQVVRQVFRGGRQVADFGSDPKLSSALYGAIIDEAHLNNIRVVAHVRNLADSKGLVAAGIDGIVNSVRDRAVDMDFIDAMIANDVFYVPTLIGHHVDFVYGDEPAWLGESYLRESVSGAVISRLRGARVVQGFLNSLNDTARRQEFDTAMVNFKSLYDAGVTIGLGTDSGAIDRFPGFFEHLEMELMVEAGLTPLEAIRIGAQGSAAILGIEEMGTLEVGKRGNFVIVPDRPDEDISASRSIAEVFREGERVDRSTMMVNFTN